MCSDERPQVMNWETWQRAIELDGSSLWDAYVLRTDHSDWQRLLDWLHASGLRLRFERGGVPEPLPFAVDDAFVHHADEETCALFIDLAGVRVNTHFFVGEEIELDIGPREVRSEHDLVRLRDLLTDIATLLGKPVLITPENGQKMPWFEIAPDGATRSFVE